MVSSNLAEEAKAMRRGILSALLGFGLIDALPAFTRGAAGFWLANSVSLAIAGSLLVRYFVTVSGRRAS